MRPITAVGGRPEPCDTPDPNVPLRNRAVVGLRQLRSKKSPTLPAHSRKELHAFLAVLPPPDLLRGVRELGFTRPTPIQEQAIPPALEGKDVLACAMTGSGKTAAFVLPILHRLIGKPRGATRALVLTPTRELAAQIEEHLERARPAHAAVGRGRLRRRRHGAAGARVPQGRRRDRRDARAGCSTTSASATRALTGLEVLVLDEADRMLDMGFLPDIRRILKHLPPRTADAVLLGDHAAADRRPVARDAAEAGDDQPRARARRPRPASPRRCTRSRRS